MGDARSFVNHTDTVSQILNTKLMTCNGRLHSYLHFLKLTGNKNVTGQTGKRENEFRGGPLKALN